MGCLKLENIAKSHSPFGMGMMTYKEEAFGSYRYGNNTQERDDEIYGEGNSYSAEYWQYDARLGRRWNIDPRPVKSISVYACFANNPIFYADVYGDSLIGTQEGADIYLNGFNKTLGDDNPFSYDVDKIQIVYDEGLVNQARAYATCKELEIIEATVYLIDNGTTEIKVVDWDATLIGVDKGSLKKAGRAGTTLTAVKPSGEFAATVYVARDAKIFTDEYEYTNPKYNEYMEMTSYDKKTPIFRPYDSDELSVAAIHEFKHPYLRVTQPALSNADHNTLVEDFENNVRSIYLIGIKNVKTRVKKFGKFEYQVLIFMEGSAKPH